jgi:hypothetical protein
MKPRKNYRTRPKKSGSKKRQRVKTQKKRLIAAGMSEDAVKHLTDIQIRQKLQETARKTRKKPVKKTQKKSTKKKAA